jgi:hypothetical protein
MMRVSTELGMSASTFEVCSDCNCSELLLSADSVEKHPLANAERCSLNTARAPSSSGFLRFLRCGNDLGQLAEVLGGGSEEELVICAARTA